MKVETENRWSWNYLKENVEDFRTIVATFVILAGLSIFFGILSPRFFTYTNLVNILVRTSVYMCLAVGMTFVMSTGGIDISIGAQIGLLSSVIGITMSRLGYSIWVSIPLVIFLGAALGLFNGFVISKIRVPAIVTTLGTMTFFRGLAYLSSGGEVFSTYPAAFLTLGRARIFDFLPVPVVIGFAVVIAGHYTLKSTQIGRHITAAGGNPEAARLAGINIPYCRMLVYVIMGALTAVATLILVSRMGAAQATMGDGYELHTISAVVLGGTALFGGRGIMFGSAMGALILSVLATGLMLIRVVYFWQLVTMGVLFILVVTVRTIRETKEV